MKLIFSFTKKVMDLEIISQIILLQGIGEEIEIERNPIGRTDVEVGSEEFHLTSQRNYAGMS